MKKIISKILFVMLMTTLISAQNIPEEIQKAIDSGEYTRAQKMISEYVSDNKLPDSEKEALLFESERLERIRKDFTKNRDQILTELEKMLPGFSFGDLEKYERDKSLEMKIIEGKKKYFKNAAANLFRTNKQMKKLKDERLDQPTDRLKDFKKAIVPKIIAESKAAEKKLVYEENFKIIYTLTVKPNAVPAGEIVKCWLPYPKENHSRQQRLKLLSTSEEKYIIAPDSVLQRTIYMKKKVKKDSATKFTFEYEFTAFAEYNDIFSKG
ncbi:MAG: transglutaminase domain-containing protein, partial [Ignavibacteria bacterium]|nr:transglutaminase domain-containing protein [Ignavibacteria bacterium]